MDKEERLIVNVYTFLYLLLFLQTKLNMNASTIYPILFIFIHTNCYGTILVIQSPAWYIYLSYDTPAKQYTCIYRRCKHYIDGPFFNTKENTNKETRTIIAHRREYFIFHV